MTPNAKNDLKDLIASVEAVLEGKGQEHEQRKFVFHHMQNTNISHPDLKKKYKQKFGHHDNFEKHVSDFMDGA